MQSPTCSAHELDTNGWREVQDHVQAFRRAHQRGERPSIGAYAPAGGPLRKAVLIELVHEEMELRLKAGEDFEAEAYLAQFPDLTADPHAVIELVEAESSLRRRSAAASNVPSRGQPEPAENSSRPWARIGRYQLQEVVGQGAFGIIYRAWDTELDRAVALKRPRCGVMDAPGAAERFLREAKSAATLCHSHIVPVFDAGRYEGAPYLVTALVEGRDLRRELALRRPPFRRSAEWIAALADALQHAHEQGVVHRDVKPSNVLIDAEERVYLTDFGLAKTNASSGATLTIDGQLLGTPAYMAPEQTTESNVPVDARTDVYSLGVVLYELLTGSRPFQGSDRMLLLRIHDEEPTPPRRLDDAVPRDLETICLKAMAKSPGHRYPDAASFAADLRRYLHGETIQARPLGPCRAFWRTCRRRPAITGLAAALLAAVTLGFAGVTWQWRRAELQRQQALQALASGSSTLRLALQLGQKDLNDPGRRRQRESFLGSLRDSLRHQSRTFPELNTTLMSVTMGALELLYRTAPREQAFAAHEQIRVTLESLARDDLFRTLPYHDALARCLVGEATILLQMGRVDEAEARVGESLDQRQHYLALAARQPEADAERRAVREAWLAADQELARFETVLDRKSEAIACRRRALALALELMPEQSRSGQSVLRLSGIQWDLANLVRDDRPDEAVSLYRAAAEVIEPTPADSPTNPAVEEFLAGCRYWLAVMEDRQNHAAAAAAGFNRARVLYERLARARPRDPDIQCLLSTCYHVLGRLQADDGHLVESLALYERAIALREKLCRLEPTSLRWRADCAGSWHRFGEALEKLGRNTEAASAYQQSLAYRRQPHAAEPSSVSQGQ